MNGRYHIEPFLRWLGIVFFSFAILSALRNFVIAEMPALAMALLIGGGATLFMLLRSIGARFNLSHRATILYLGLIVVVGIVLRIYWIATIPTQPVSDFEAYHRLALHIAQGSPPAQAEKPLGYPAILAVIYAFSPNILSGKLLNVILSSVGVLLAFGLALPLGGRLAALSSALLLALWPSDIALNSVLGTDIPGAMFLGGAVLASARALNGGSVSRRGSALAGTLLAFSVLMRTVALAFAPALLALCLVGKARWSDRAARSTIFACSFAATVGAFIVWHSLSIASLSFNSVRYASGGYLLLAGTNYEAKGLWNEKDSQFYNSLPVGDRENLALAEAWRRIQADPSAFLSLVAEKQAILFGDDLYGIYWGTLKTSESGDENRLRTLYRISQVFYVLVLLCCLVAFIRIRNASHRFHGLILAFLFTMVAVFVPLEVQSRYHHVLLPLLAATAGLGISSLTDVSES